MSSFQARSSYRRKKIILQRASSTQGMKTALRSAVNLSAVFSMSAKLVPNPTDRMICCGFYLPQKEGVVEIAELTQLVRNAHCEDGEQN